MRDLEVSTVIVISPEQLSALITQAVREALGTGPDVVALTAAAAAERLSVTPAHVRDLVRRGELVALPRVRKGAIRIPASEVARYLRRR